MKRRLFLAVVLAVLAVVPAAFVGWAVRGMAEEPGKSAAAHSSGVDSALADASKTPEQAAEHFTWFAHFAAMDVAASSKQTQENLGWYPTQRGLIADIDGPSYFKA